ncbi:hypothetical protein ACMBCN_03160, partial [Candidatus Liberibacter asiaticus]|nr:hypothetical protein [Candidatus Liberibacter asiaticus]
MGDNITVFKMQHLTHNPKIQYTQFLFLSFFLSLSFLSFSFLFFFLSFLSSSLLQRKCREFQNF